MLGAYEGLCEEEATTNRVGASVKGGKGALVGTGKGEAVVGAYEGRLVGKGTGSALVGAYEGTLVGSGKGSAVVGVVSAWGGGERRGADPERRQEPRTSSPAWRRSIKVLAPTGRRTHHHRGKFRRRAFW